MTGEAVLVKQVVTIPPVPATGRTVLALPANPTVPVGYIHLRAFLSTAEPLLRTAYEEFRSQGIQNFIVDFRYNGGGLTALADFIGDLNGLERDRDDEFSRMLFNDRKSSNDSVHRFDPQPESVDPVRIAFITTGATASASELVINSMKPWAEVAIVGADTYGKPVGQFAFDLGLCDFRMRLVTFRMANADGESDYYQGLASTVPFACAADDDLTRVPGDVAEGATAAALGWLGSGACDTLIAPDSARLAALGAARLPRGPPRGSAQANLPGIQ
jgi:C-terminal processing protease CtpA/Prc